LNVVPHCSVIVEPDAAGLPNVYKVMVRNAGWSKKHTPHNIERTGDFVVNIVSEGFVDQMNATSGEYAADVDEFQVSGLTPVSSLGRMAGTTYVRTGDRFDMARPVVSAAMRR
jgi:hypothetical protein